MYAHRTIETITNLHIQIDLPTEFAHCQQAEIIVLPITPSVALPKSWQERVLAVAGTLSDDFPDDIDDSDLGQDAPRESLE
ncbi:conserved hypothetical protein [Gammaproteobacteria bacterium]